MKANTNTRICIWKACEKKNCLHFEMLTISAYGDENSFRTDFRSEKRKILGL